MNLRRIGGGGAFGALMLSGIGVVTLLRIWRAGRSQHLAPADAIVVFGAAVWATGPSPTLRMRTMHGAELYHRGLAPLVICSGGTNGAVSEPMVMAEIMRAQGVPEAALILDEDGTTTRHTLLSVGRLGAGRWRKILAVSSPFHVFRIVEEARRHGIEALPCPARRRPAKSLSAALRLRWWDTRQYAREAVAVWTYRLTASQASGRGAQGARDGDVDRGGASRPRPVERTH